MIPQLYAVKELTRADRKLLWLYVLRTLSLCLLGPWFLVAMVPLYFKYHTLRYRFDEEGIGMSWGILWRREIYLTYTRIQDIHLSRGLFERWLGLATIQVQTASGSSGSDMSIVGLTEFELVRDFLYSRMRGAEADRADAAAHDPQLELLRELLAEVRRLRLALAPGSDELRGRGGLPH
ncbi:MAG TPA: PH domain-containing protein [Polyangiaceae bacterium]|nr:PH domain-containing protein [Polyangiaceae bacterium]